jgi:hypothetical protein
MLKPIAGRATNRQGGGAADLAADQADRVQAGQPDEAENEQGD